MARTQSWSGGELDDQRHDRVGAGIVEPLGPSLAPVVVGGLEAVVAVGEHHERRTDCVGDGAEALRVVDPPERVVEAVLVGGGGVGLGVARGEQRREPAGERQAPDRVEVRAGGAQQLEPIGLGLGQRALVGHDATAVVVEREGTEHTGGALRSAVVAGEVHAVDRERRRRRR